MAGNSEGGKKAALTTKEKYGEDFHKKAGSKSWSDPNRSHETGFALLTEEERKKAGKKGGSRKKEDYHPYCDHTFGQFECGEKVKRWGEKCSKHKEDYHTPETKETSSGTV